MKSGGLGPNTDPDTSAVSQQKRPPTNSGLFCLDTGLTEYAIFSELEPVILDEN